MAKKYIGCEIIQAEPITLGAYNIFRGWTIPQDENPNEKGYKITYFIRGKAQYTYKPKSDFDRTYYQLEEGTKITQGDLNGFVEELRATTEPNGRSTITRLDTITGFNGIEVSTCVSKENYSQLMGAEIGKKKFEDKLWLALGFMLRWAVYGLDDYKKKYRVQSGRTKNA